MMLDIIVALLVWLGGNPPAAPIGTNVPSVVMTQRDWCSRPCITDTERRRLTMHVKYINSHAKRYGDGQQKTR